MTRIFENDSTPLTEEAVRSVEGETVKIVLSFGVDEIINHTRDEIITIANTLALGELESTYTLKNPTFEADAVISAHAINLLVTCEIVES